MTYGLIGFKISDGHTPASNVWMAAPDIIAFSVDDPPIIPGNIVTGDFSARSYNTWSLMTNPRSGQSEYSCVFGPLKDRVKFSDLPNPSGYKDKIALRNVSNYTVTGATLSAVYYRDETNGHGYKYGTNSQLSTQRHTIYLKFSAPISNGTVITISNSQPNTFSSFSFTFNDRVIRAGGIQVNQIGYRADDNLRYAYLAARIPGAANNGTVDFAGTYGLSTFQVLNSAKTSVYSGSITQRLSPSEREQIASFTGFIDDGTGGGSPSGVSGNKLTITSFTEGFITIGVSKVVSADAALSAATVTITGFVSGTNGGAGVYTVSSSLNLGSQAMWVPDGYPTGIDVADMSQGWSITAISKAASGVVTAPGHTLQVGDKVRFLGINGMTQLEGPPQTTNTSLWIAPTVTAVSGDDFTINVNTSSFTTFANTTLLDESLGGINNRAFKCFNTNRAGTYVFGLDMSGWTPASAGIYYIYIPGYGISDPFQIKSDIWAHAAAKTHQGLFNLRLGIDVSSDSGYSRGSAVTDGVGGWTCYQSTLPAMFCSEGGQAITPAGASATIYAGNGGYSDQGTLTITTLSCSGTTITANTSGSIGLSNGTVFYAQIAGCSPTTYNTAGYNVACTVASSTSFTYTVGANISSGTGGFAITGFVTSVRTGGRPGHQDAGDNDDLAVDHLPYWKLLAMVFRNIPKPSRFTPYTVPLSSSVLNPTLFAGTDLLPPLFHEMFWYAEAYRTTQEADGSIWGGYGYSGNVNSQSPSYPETIDYYRGNDAGGSLTGQTVMGFSYARDHYTTFLYAGFAALLAQIAYDYGLTTLGDTYKASAIAAYSWADGIATSPATCDAYYKGVLNLKTKAGWSETSYQDAMLTLNQFNNTPGLAIRAKGDAAGSLYRLLGSSAGQTPYGDFLEKNACIVASVTNGGSGYAVNDFIVLAGGTNTVPVTLIVTAVSGGVITSVKIMNMGQYSANPSNPVSQASTTGTGTGATFNLIFAAFYTQIVSSIGATDYCLTTGANATAKTYLRANNGNRNPDINLTSKLSYMGMVFNVSPLPSTIGTMAPQEPLKALQAHIQYVAVNGADAGAYSSKYLRLMQAGASLPLGANFQAKAFQVGTGQRSSSLLLHEDSYKKGLPAPYGILPFGYYGWATSLMFGPFQGSLRGAEGMDGPSSGASDNVSGQWQSEPTPGSAKMWNPWRGGSSYWEWAAEHHDIIYNSEFSQAAQISNLAIQLYLHGWDGNT